MSMTNTKNLLIRINIFPLSFSFFFFPLLSLSSSLSTVFKEIPNLLFSRLQEPPTSKDNRTELVTLIDIPYEMQQRLAALPDWIPVAKKPDCNSDVFKKDEVTNVQHNPLEHNNESVANTINSTKSES